MYKINDILATHGLGDAVDHTVPLKFSVRIPGREMPDGEDRDYERPVLKDYPKIGYLDPEKEDWFIVDVRDLLDDYNPLQMYKDNIAFAVAAQKKFGTVVICCSQGVSRSNAIAVGFIMERHHFDFYDALEYVRNKVPICNIAPPHIEALKKIYNVGLP